MTAQIGIVRQTRLLRQSGPIFSFAAGVAAYVGPGDVVSGALRWYGLRAYSAAKAGTKAVNIRASGDNATTDINTLSNGNLDVATISSFLTTHGGNAFVTKIYDQTGGGNDLSQATAANQPQLVLSLIGSLPGMTFVSANSTILSSAVSNFTLAQPNTINAVARRTSGTTASEIFSGVNNELVFEAAGKIGNGVFTANQTDGNFHAFQSVGNGAASDLNVDAVSTTGTQSQTDTNSPSSIGAYESGIQFLNGNILEVGIWTVAFSSSQESNMSSNQHNYWGF